MVLLNAGESVAVSGGNGGNGNVSSADLIRTLGDAISSLLSLEVLAGLILWLGILWMLPRALDIVATVWSSRRLGRWLPMIRLGAAAIALLLVVGAAAPDSPGGQALLVVLLLLTAIWSLRDVLRNLAAGTVVIARHAVRLGDYLRIGTHEGQVVGVSLRGVTLHEPDGTLTVVPNVALHREVTTYVNRRGQAVPVTLHMPVPAERLRDPEAVRVLAARMGRLSPRRAPGSPVLVHVDQDVGRVALTVSPFHADEAEALRQELADRLRAAW